MKVTLLGHILSVLDLRGTDRIPMCSSRGPLLIAFGSHHNETDNSDVFPRSAAEEDYAENVP